MSGNCQTSPTTCASKLSKQRGPYGKELDSRWLLVVGRWPILRELETRCTSTNPFAALIKSSSGGPSTYRSAPAFTSSGGSGPGPISWLLTDTSFSKVLESARSTLNTETGGLRSLSIHASTSEKQRTSETGSP